MKYGFTTVLDRKGKEAIAVDNAGKSVWGSESDAQKKGFDFVPL